VQVQLLLTQPQHMLWRGMWVMLLVRLLVLLALHRLQGKKQQQQMCIEEMVSGWLLPQGGRGRAAVRQPTTSSSSSSGIR
jgi:hypothetical protein